MRKQSEKFFHVIAMVVIMLLGLTSCGKQSKWQKQYDLGMKYLEAGDYEEALNAFDKAISIDEKEATAYVGRGAVYMALAQAVPEEDTVENNGEAQEENQEDDDQENEGGRQAQLLKVKKDENPDNLAGADKKLGYYEKAVQDYETALDLDETLTDARRGKGNALFEEGKLLDEEKQKEKFDEALQEFEKVIEAEDRESADYISMGDIYASSGETEENFQKAEDCYQQASELDETNDDAYLGLADVRLRQEKYGEALDILEQGYEKTKSDAIQEKIDAMKGGAYTDRQGRNLRRSYVINGTLYYLLFQYGSGKQPTHVAAYTGSGELINELDLTYDKNGHGIDTYGLTWSITKGTFCLEKYIDTYDEQGRLEKSEHFMDGNYVYLDVYQYEGNTRRCESYFDGKHSDYYDITEYDADGKEIKSTTYNTNGISSYSVEEYDSAGHNIKSSYYSADGNLTSYEEKKWENDKVVEYNNYYASGDFFHSCIYEYDKYGNIIMETINEKY